MDNRMFKAPPCGEEIKQVVMGFPKEKALGGDGITYDFLKEYIGDLLAIVALPWF